MADERIEVDVVVNADNVDAINSVASGLQNLSGVVSSVGSNIANGTSSLRGYVNGFIDLNDSINSASRRVRSSLSGFHNMWVSGLRTAVSEIKSLTKEAIENYTLLSEQHAKTTGAMHNNYNLNTSSGQRQFAQDSEALKQQAIQQARTGPTGQGSLYNVVDVSAAQTELVKAGVKPQDILKTDVLNTILKFAQANDLSTDNAVTFATALGNQFDVPYKKWGDMLDMVSHAADLSPIDVGDIVTSMRYAGGITSGLGRSMEEVLALVTMMGQFGLKGSQAGTAVQSLYTRLLTGDTTVITEAQAEVAPEKALKAFYDFSMFAKTDGSKLTYEDIEKADTYEKLGEISGNLRPMDEVVDQLDEVLSTMNDQEQAWFIKKFFGLYQMKGAYALINGDTEGGTGEGSIEDYEEEIRDNSIGTNDAKFKQLIESDYGKQTALDVAIDSTKTDIGGRLSPLVNEIRGQLYEFLNDPNNYQIDFDGIREALGECSDLIAEQYGDAIAELIEKIGSGVIDITEIGIEFAPDFAEGVINILNAIADIDAQGVVEAWNNMIDQLDLSVGDLPPNLQELGDKVVGVTKAFGILMGLDIGSRILETLTNALKVIQILGGAVINAGSVVVNGEFPGGIPNAPVTDNDGNGTSSGKGRKGKKNKDTTTTTSTSSTSSSTNKSSKSSKSTKGSKSTKSNKNSNGSNTSSSSEGNTNVVVPPSSGEGNSGKKWKTKNKKAETKPAEEAPVTPATTEPDMSKEHKQHIKADADDIMSNPDSFILNRQVLTDEQINTMSMDDINARLTELNKVQRNDPNWNAVTKEKQELYDLLYYKTYNEPSKVSTTNVYDDTGYGNINGKTALDPNLNKIKDYMRVGDGGILTDEQLSNMSIEEIDARIAELDKVKGKYGAYYDTEDGRYIKGMEYQQQHDYSGKYRYDPSYYNKNDPANAEFELAKQEKDELYSLKRYRKDFGENTATIVPPVVEEPKNTSKTEVVNNPKDEGTLKGTKTVEIGEGRNKTEPQKEAENRAKFKEEVPPTTTNAVDGSQMPNTQTKTHFNLFNPWMPESRLGKGLFNGALFASGITGMIGGSYFGSQIGDWLEQKITGEDGWFGDTFGGLGGGIAGQYIGSHIAKNLISAGHNLGVGAKSIFGANQQLLSKLSGLGTGLAAIAPYLIVAGASAKTGFQMYNEKKNREDLHNTRESGETPAWDGNGNIIRDSGGNVVTYEELSRQAKKFAAERAAREDEYQYNNGQVMEVLRESEPDDVNILKPSTWGNGKKKKQWREDNDAAEQQRKKDEENFYAAQQQLYYDSGILLKYNDFQNNYEGFTNYIDALNKDGYANLSDFDVDQSVIDRFTVASEQWAIAFIEQVNKGIENTNKYKQEEINKIDPSSKSLDQINLRNQLLATPDFKEIPNTEESRNQILDGVTTADNPNEKLAENLGNFLNNNITTGESSSDSTIFTRLDSLNSIAGSILDEVAQILGGDRNNTEKSTLNDKVDNAVEKLNEYAGKHDTLEGRVNALTKDENTRNKLTGGIYAFKDPSAALDNNLRDLLIKGQPQPDNNTIQNQLENLNNQASEISGKIDESKKDEDNTATKADVETATKSALQMTIPDIIANLSGNPNTKEKIDNKIEQTIQMVDQSQLTITPQTTPVSVSPNIVVQVHVDNDGNVTMTKSQQNTLFNMITNYNVSKSRSYNNASSQAK